MKTKLHILSTETKYHFPKDWPQSRGSAVWYCEKERLSIHGHLLHKQRFYHNKVIVQKSDRRILCVCVWGGGGYEV